MEVEADWIGAADVKVDMLGFLDVNGGNICSLPLLYCCLVRKGHIEDLREDYRGGDTHTLLVSLAKNTAPLPIPSVPFNFFPFLSTSDTAQVLISSALAFAFATLSAGSTYVLTGRGG